MPLVQIQRDAGVTRTVWLGKSAELPDPTLLGCRRCSAVCPVFCVKLVLLALPQIACLHITILWQEVWHMQPAPAQDPDTWGRKQRQAWKKAIAPALGSDISSSYLPCPGTCLPLPPLQLCVLMSCLITTQTKRAPVWHKKSAWVALDWLYWCEVKPYGNAYSLSPLDGAKSCSPPLCLSTEKSLLKLFQGAKEASWLPRAMCLLQFGKIKCPVQNPRVFSHLFQVEKLSMR